MNRLLDRLDSTWQRVGLAAVLSGAIVLSLNAFAASSYEQTQKIQQESARGQHCQKWSYEKRDKEVRPVCVKWPK
jgi:hypothetical protein